MMPWFKRQMAVPPMEEPADTGLHPAQVPGYEPKFDRLSVTRRVLAHITDEDHVGRGPRNTLVRLVQELQEDPHTPGVLDAATVQAHLDLLVGAGLAERGLDVYRVTAAGLVELRN